MLSSESDGEMRDYLESEIASKQSQLEALDPRCASCSFPATPTTART